MFHQSYKHILLGTFVALFIITVPIYAVQDFKISNYGGGSQIWFEAEHFDKLDPSDFCSIVDEPGAFGQAMNRSVNDGIVVWTFDISTAGGKGGTWYFWGRVINPSNQSDYMLVEGHPSDPVVPTEPPYPGNKNPIFDDTMDRIFEQNIGPPWGWAPGTAEAHEEGHTKELRNGSNTMCIYDRQGTSAIFWDVFMWTDNPDYVPTDEDYQNAWKYYGGKASCPSPADQAIDVPREVVLSWIPGAFAAPTNGHKLYFGESFEDVNAGVGGIAQSANSYTPPQRLDFGTTYYWRIDEVNGPPDFTVYPGAVWSFTTEPIGYAISGGNIIATASSANKDLEGPENTINGSGLDDNDLHSFESTDMWLSSITGEQPTWIQYEFDRVYKLYQMMVWNYNSSVEVIVGFSIREATIEYSVDGTNWAVLGTTHEFAQGPGEVGYACNTTVDLGGVAAKYVRITANSNWGGIVNQYGLSEVRFLYIPVWATEPSPVSGATDLDVNAILNWKAGREAATHDVYLGADEQAVIDGNVPVATVTEPSYAASLDLAGTYYWRVDEVNDAEIPTTWQGDIWNLSTQEYLVVDDFESYNDIAAGQEGCNLVYDKWADGFENPANGSTIGYNEPFQPTMETSFVYDGRQSVPLYYDNTVATYSEVTAKVADLGVDRDWSKHGIKALTLRFLGDPNNILQQMYVKINGSKVTYDGSAEDTRLTAWQMWYIDLSSVVGVSLNNVTDLTIGFERIGAVGGQGMVYLDGIRLYSYDRQLVTPVEPGTTGLQAHYKFEGNTNDSSVNARNGTIMGDPTFVAGKIGQAINLRGLNDYVEITGYKGILGTNAVTVAAWIRSSSTDTGAIIGWGPNIAGQRFGFRVNSGRLRIENQGGNVQGDTVVNDGNWHHVAVTVQDNATASYPDVILYLDGQDDTRPTTDSDAFNLTAGEDVRIGSRPSNDDRFFLGQIDEVRIYNGTLSREEIAWLAGRIVPFDKPF